MDVKEHIPIVSVREPAEDKESWRMINCRASQKKKEIGKVKRGDFPGPLNLSNTFQTNLIKICETESAPIHWR